MQQSLAIWRKQVDRMQVAYQQALMLITIDFLSTYQLVAALTVTIWTRCDTNKWPCVDSDGAKQSGLLLACLSLMQQMIMDSDVDVPTTVKLIKNDQPMFISTPVSSTSGISIRLPLIYMYIQVDLSCKKMFPPFSTLHSTVGKIWHRADYAIYIYDVTWKRSCFCILELSSLETSKRKTRMVLSIKLKVILVITDLTPISQKWLRRNIVV